MERQHRQRGQLYGKVGKRKSAAPAANRKRDQQQRHKGWQGKSVGRRSVQSYTFVIEP